MASNTEQRKVEIIMNGQKVNASLKEMKASASLLWNQLQKLPQGSKEFVAKSAEFQKVSQRLKGVTAEARGVNKGMSLLSGTVGKLFAGFGAYTVLNKLGQAYDYVTGKTKVFEKSLDKLQSITGATADDMAFYRGEALEMGKTTTLSASRVADAYTIIGSKKPELLKSKEALVAVTKETIALAEAAEIDLVPSAEALTGVLNQWEEPASEASRVINVLAAGSKYGAGNIEYLNDSMLRFGPAALSAKISIEQSAAAMELFAEKGIPSEKAGVSFRNILIELSQGADEYNPKVVGLSTALDNLAADYTDAGDIAKKFGSQNSIAAQVLIESRGRVEEFTKALTGTNVAYEQQAINIDNWEGDLKSLDSVTESLALGLGDRLLPALRWVTQGFRDLLSMVSDWISVPTSEKLEQERAKMNNLVGAIELTNEGSRERNALIGELQTRYPDFMKNLDAETVTNEQLRDRLKEVNAQYEQKILNQLKEEEITELLKEQIELRESERNLLLAIAGENEKAASGQGVRGANKANMKKNLEETREAMAALQTEIDGLDDKYRDLGLTMATNTEVVEATKKANVDLVEEEEKLTTAQIQSQRAFQDLKIELIRDSYEREREQTTLKYNREIEDLDKKSENYLQHVIMLEERKKMALDELKLQHEEEAAKKKEEEEQLKLEEMEAEEEKRLLEVENAFMNAQDAEQRKEDAIYDIKKKAAEDKLALMRQMHGEDSLEVERAKNELLELEKGYNDQVVASAKEAAELKSQLRQKNLMELEEGYRAGMDILRKESSARKAAAKALKAWTIGKIIIDLQKEIQAIWQTANASPLNILIPGSGALIAAGKTAAATLRAANSIRKVKSQKFAGGGLTIPMVEIDGVWRRANPIGSFSGGGMYTGNNLGVIGEKGTEWVAPNWMLKNPATANLIGMLEAKRKQVEGFGAGGMTISSPPQAPQGGDLTALLGLLTANNKLLAQQNSILMELPANIKVWLSLVELDEGLKVLQKLRDDASIAS